MLLVSWAQSDPPLGVCTAVPALMLLSSVHARLVQGSQLGGPQPDRCLCQGELGAGPTGRAQGDDALQAAAARGIATR